VRLLESGWPVMDQPLRYQANRAVEGEAAVAVLAGFDVEMSEAEAGQPVERADQRRLSASSLAESKDDGQIESRSDGPGRRVVTRVGEVVEDAGGGWSDDGQPPASAVGMVDGDVAWCWGRVVGESGGDLLDVHAGLLGVLVPPIG